MTGPHTAGTVGITMGMTRKVQKYLLNPGMRSLILAGVAPRIFALVETTGRRTGLRRLTPVTVARDGNVVWLVAEHGWRCGYVQNLFRSAAAAAQDRAKLAYRHGQHAAR